MTTRAPLSMAIVRLGEPEADRFRLLPPSHLLYHLAWLRQCRLLGQAQVFDQRVDADAIFEFAPKPWDMIVIALEPATFRVASAFAKMCKAESANTLTVGLGQAIGLDRATGSDGWDLLIHGHGYAYLEAIARGERPRGLVGPNPYPAPVVLPEEAFAYRYGAVRGSWGTIDRTNWRERKGDFAHLEFRRVAHIWAEIQRAAASSQVEYYHFVDAAFLGHPDFDAIIENVVGKPWGVTLDGRRRRGIVSRLTRAQTCGLRIVQMDLASLDGAVLSQAGKAYRYEQTYSFWRYTSRLRADGLTMVAELRYGLPQQTTASVENDEETCERFGIIPLFRHARLDIGSYFWQHRDRLRIEADACGKVMSTAHMSAQEIEELTVSLGAKNAKRLDTIAGRC